MTATTGTRVVCNTTTLCNTTTICGQGTKPDLWVLYSTSAFDASLPVWSDATPQVRAWSTRRGRNSELDQVESGAADILLNARDRALDPFSNAALTAMNRWWIRAQFSGATRDVFKGYAEAYDVDFPAKGKDATVVVRCVDEFKPLAADKLPTTDPPRDSYGDLVMFDAPTGYWPIDHSWSAFETTEVGDTIAAAVGENLVMMVNPFAVWPDGAILGEQGGAVFIGQDDWYVTNPLSPGQSGDIGEASEFTIEGWFGTRSPATATRVFAQGPQGNAADTWKIEVTTANLVQLTVNNSGGTAHVLTSSSQYGDEVGFDVFGRAHYQDGWTHVVGAVSAGDLHLYINGVEEDSTAWAGTVAPVDPGTFGVLAAANGVSVGNLGTDISPEQMRVDQLAVYRTGLTADRVVAHYDAGRNRGFPSREYPGERINHILDLIASKTPRYIRTGSHQMTAAYMRGQPPLEEMRQAEVADAVDAVLFVAKDGTITFLDDGHRSVSPWDTVQATFDDDGTDLPYRDLRFDYSDAFLANTWNVTRVGGLTSSATDATSVSSHGSRPQVPDPPAPTRRPSIPLLRPEVPILDDADAAAIAAAMLAKYKNPFIRISELTVDLAAAAAIDTVLGLELGDRIRVFKTHPGGGSRIDQTLFVQSIAVDADPRLPWVMRLGVSPV